MNTDKLKERPIDKNSNVILFDIATKMARDLLDIGNELNIKSDEDYPSPSPVHRIQFMGGEYPDNEIPQGGMNELALTNWIFTWLKYNIDCDKLLK